MKKVEIKKSQNGQVGLQKTHSKEWSATHRIRLPHKIGTPLGTSGCCDGSAPKE